MQNRAAWTATATALALALLGAALVTAPAPAGAAQVQTVALVRNGSGTIPSTGGSVVLPLEVLDVASLGAATVLINYDSTVISATHYTRGAAFDVLVPYLSYDGDGDGRPDAVYLAAVSLLGVTTTAGIPVNVASLTWTLLGTPDPGVTITLALSVTNFAENLGGEPIPVSTQDGQILIVPGYKVHLPVIIRGQ